MKANTIYMKINENGTYVIDRNSRKSLKQNLLEKFSEDECIKDLINNTFDYPNYSEQTPEDLAERLLNKNIKNITPK